jgi:hypothetical protein
MVSAYNLKICKPRDIYAGLSQSDAVSLFITIPLFWISGAPRLCLPEGFTVRAQLKNVLLHRRH